MPEPQHQPGRSLPIQGWVGAGLIGIFWPLNWLLTGNRTAYLFFPLWLGYVLLVDGLVFRRTGTSIASRSPWNLPLLFLASSPVWWIFEVINQRTRNWEYVGAEQFSPLGYYALCTISFSTVIPAVFETAELVRGFAWVERLRPRRGIRPTNELRVALLLVGLGMLAATLHWPRCCYPFVWTSLVLILEPLNGWLKRPTLLDFLQRGDWRPIIALCLGALICGFFWEMWNFYSFPKWIYHTPGAQFLHVFEMPILGYGGYIPFALELFELKSLLLPRLPEPRV